MELGLSTYQTHETIPPTAETIGRISLNAAGRYKVIHLDGTEVTAIPKQRTLTLLVGDWVNLSPQMDFDLITARFPRYSTLNRLTGAGYRTEEKAAASNLDRLFICISMNKNFKSSRIKRYLDALIKPQYQTTLVLTKADLNPESDALAAQLSRELAIPVLCTSSYNGSGVASLKQQILPGQTVSFYGNSGVGKSTLVNAVAEQDVMATSMISDKTDKGKHTTTSSRLVPIPTGDFILIDTPGIKSVGVGTNNLAVVFPDITALAADCRFHNCTHTQEPGCAVMAAVANGQLNADTYQQYLELQAESQSNLGYLEAKTAKKLHKKAKSKRQTLSKKHYRKPLW